MFLPSTIDLLQLDSAVFVWTIFVRKENATESDFLTMF